MRPAQIRATLKGLNLELMRYLRQSLAQKTPPYESPHRVQLRRDRIVPLLRKYKAVQVERHERWLQVELTEREAAEVEAVVQAATREEQKRCVMWCYKRFAAQALSRRFQGQETA